MSMDMYRRVRSALHRHDWRPGAYIWDIDEGSYWRDVCRCGETRRRATAIPRNVAVKGLLGDDRKPSYPGTPGDD